MSTSGVVKSFNDEKGWGFINCDSVEGDIFLHVKQCQDGRPTVGDEVSFDLEDDGRREGQWSAVNVTGCTGKSKGEGQGEDSGKTRARVKSFNDAKGWGFVEYEGQDVFLHVKDCLHGRPQVGDMVSFDLEDDGQKAGSMQAKNVTGCTGIGGKGNGKGHFMGGCGGAAMMRAPPGVPMMMGGCYGWPLMAVYGGGAAKGGGKGGGKGQFRGGSCNGLVKSFNDKKGYGFIDFQGNDVFLLVKECDARPQAGDWVTFDVEPDPARPGQFKAINVIGCTGAGDIHSGNISFGPILPAGGSYGCSPYGGKGGRRGGK